MYSLGSTTETFSIAKKRAASIQKRFFESFGDVRLYQAYKIDVAMFLSQKKTPAAPASDLSLPSELGSPASGRDACPTTVQREGARPGKGFPKKVRKQIKKVKF